jgi:hypothetical protein
MADNGWNEWSRHVLAELERLSDAIESLDKSFNEANLINVKDITELKVKAAILGACAGAVPGILLALIMYFVIGG